MGQLLRQRSRHHWPDDLLNGEPRVVIGVMPPLARGRCVGSKAPGSQQSANAAGGDQKFSGASEARRHAPPGGTGVVAARRKAREGPPDAYPSKFRMQVVNVIEYTVGPFSTVLYITLAAVLMLLLIACCNVAKMLLARKRASARDAWRPGNHGGRQPNVCRDLFPRHRSHRDSFFASRRRQLGTRLDRRCSRWPGWFKT